ncbi:hypothetical protein LTR53_011432 [Teratosphaeriaceae sp. CCFEE 6253]|nr:hypothetical protein LTR53_011432 [Teratosphaeriaceae sp. CCFEE 6253]
MPIWTLHWADWQPKGPFAFLALAPELRNHIYEYAVVEEAPIAIPEPWRRDLRWTPIPLPGILGTSRQIRREALPIYYGDNVFESCYAKSTEIWLDGLPDRILPMLRHLRAFDGINTSWPASEALRRDKTLKLVDGIMTGRARGLLKMSAIVVPVHERVGSGYVWVRMDELLGHGSAPMPAANGRQVGGGS